MILTTYPLPSFYRSRGRTQFRQGSRAEDRALAIRHRSQVHHRQVSVVALGAALLMCDVLCYDHRIYSCASTNNCMHILAHDYDYVCFIRLLQHV